MKRVLLGAAVLALASCGEGATDVGEERSDGQIQMQAGKWKNTMVIEKFDMPGAPPEAAQFLQAMVGQETSNEQCMTEDEVAKGLEEQAKGSMDNEECTTEEFSAQGGKIKGRILCNAENGGTAKMTIDGDHTGTSMNMQMTAEIEDSSMPGGQATMVMRVTGERIGDCDA